jgi:hypothetical protein
VKTRGRRNYCTQDDIDAFDLATATRKEVAAFHAGWNDCNDWTVAAKKLKAQLRKQRKPTLEKSYRPSHRQPFRVKEPK